MKMERLYCRGETDWRKWLAENHDKQSEIWLVFYKNEKKSSSISYETAVNQALCYGWIDSIVKRIDESSYVLKFTPRKAKSNWSESNKARVQKLMDEGIMAKPGLELVEAAKKNGSWDKSGRPTAPREAPQEFLDALKENGNAKKEYDNLAPSHKKQYILWILSAKKAETKEKRIREAIALLEKRRKLGLK